MDCQSSNPQKLVTILCFRILVRLVLLWRSRKHLYKILLLVTLSEVNTSSKNLNKIKIEFAMYDGCDISDSLVIDRVVC